MEAGDPSSRSASELTASPEESEWPPLESAGIEPSSEKEQEERQKNIQNYVDSMRAQFFPMVLYMDRAEQLMIPSRENFKQLLYDNDIGYKREVNNKLYVKRFYKIPSLLFPEETLLTYLLHLDRGAITRQWQDMEETDKDEYLVVHLAEAGLINETYSDGDSSSLSPEAKKVLEGFKASLSKYIQQHVEREKVEIDSVTGITRLSGNSGTTGWDMSMSASSTSEGYTRGIDMSFLDDLILGTETTAAESQGDASRGYGMRNSASASGAMPDTSAMLDSIVTQATGGDMVPISDDEGSSHSEDQGGSHELSSSSSKGTRKSRKFKEEEKFLAALKRRVAESQKKVTKLTPFSKHPPRDQMTESEWNAVAEEYLKSPKTRLDEDREKFYSALETRSKDEAEDESDLYELRQIRIENKIIAKARLEQLYEEKEAARRVAEWKRRKVFKGFKVPKPRIHFRRIK